MTAAADASGSPSRRDARHGAPASRLLVALALIPTALIALPVIYVLMRAWGAGWSGVWAELARPRTLMLLGNTLTLCLSVTLFASLIGYTAAWFTERTDLAGKWLWRVLCCLPLAMPAFVASFAWKSLGPGFQGMSGAILILTMESFPLKVTLPRTLPALGGGALLVAAHMLSEFGALALLRVQTFTTAIFQQYELQFDNASAAVLSGLLMLLCLPVAFGEMWLRRGVRLSKVGRNTARRGSPARLGRWAPLVMLGFVAVSIVSLGVPFGRLGYWLVRGVSAGRGLDALGPALFGSLSLALPGTLVTTVIALPLVLLVLRSRGVFARFADRLPYVVHGLPGLVVALALVYLSIRLLPAIYQTRAVLFAAYAILFLPLAQSAIRASAELVPREIEEVARTLGRSPWQAFVSVTLPSLAPGLGAALALVALELMRELTATLILAPTGVVTLATEVWSHTNDSAYAAAAPFAALLVLISGLPVYIFTLRTLRPRPDRQVN
ncbi:MAG: iron ABC transporter permease [Rhizobiales bacterium]|nr:iron ABC transporter permease [Hyphomicrobiales bacterium]